jgi:hypothetical protein
MIKLCLIFLGVGVLAFLLSFKAPLKTRLIIAFLASVVPIIISFTIILYSGDKAAQNAVEYKGPKDNLGQKDTNSHGK